MPNTRRMMMAAAGAGASPEWDIEGWSYKSKSFDTSGQATIGGAIAISNDGTKMYFAGTANPDGFGFQYTLSTPFDAGTGSYASKSYDFTQEAEYTGFFLRDDGAKCYAIGTSGKIVYQYTLSTSDDISTASYDSKSFSVSSQAAGPTGIWFKADGTQMFITDTDTGDKIYQYTLSTPWDVSSASYDSKSFSHASQTTNPRQSVLDPSGLRMWVVGEPGEKVYQYDLSIAFDITSAVYNSVSVDASTQVTSGSFGLAFASDGSALYVFDSGQDEVFQYGP